jgi:hypothetical protein
MEFKPLVMSLTPHEILTNALDYQMIPHESLSPSINFLQQLNESPEEILELHSLALHDDKDTETKTLKENQNPKNKNCSIT